MHYPPQLLRLIDALRQLPGVGAKTAERYAFHMLDWPHEKLKAIAEVIDSTPDQLSHCKNCGCLTDPNLPVCTWCNPEKRDARLMAVIATAKDAFSLEESAYYQGHYHVLGGTLSPIDGRGPEHLHMERLHERLAQLQTEELIIALDSTIEGDATALFIKKELENSQLRITRLAFGIPMGSSLDYVDSGTLARALAGRS